MPCRRGVQGDHVRPSAAAPGQVWGVAGPAPRTGVSKAAYPTNTAGGRGGVRQARRRGLTAKGTHDWRWRVEGWWGGGGVVWWGSVFLSQRKGVWGGCAPPLVNAPRRLPCLAEGTGCTYTPARPAWRGGAHPRLVLGRRSSRGGRCQPSTMKGRCRPIMQGRCRPFFRVWAPTPLPTPTGL